MTTSFRPTHKITFTARDGERTDFVVMLHDEGAAYSREEWEQAANASWSCDPDSGEWTCEGQVTPGGANGTVEVSEIGAVVSYEIVSAKPNGHVGERILFSTRERADDELVRLAAAFGCDESDLRIVERAEAPDAGF